MWNTDGRTNGKRLPTTDSTKFLFWRKEKLKDDRRHHPITLSVKRWACMYPFRRTTPINSIHSKKAEASGKVRSSVKTILFWKHQDQLLVDTFWTKQQRSTTDLFVRSLTPYFTSFVRRVTPACNSTSTIWSRLLDLFLNAVVPTSAMTIKNSKTSNVLRWAQDAQKELLYYYRLTDIWTYDKCKFL